MKTTIGSDDSTSGGKTCGEASKSQSHIFRLIRRPRPSSAQQDVFTWTLNQIHYSFNQMNHYKFKILNYSLRKSATPLLRPILHQVQNNSQFFLMT